MSAAVDQGLVLAIATELGVDPSFVEKDWHAMRMVAAIANVKHDTLRPVFSGGTNLSKAYGLIRRFSEDLDFKIDLSGADIKRRTRSQYRRQIVEAIRATGEWTVPEDKIVSRNDSKFFSCLVDYRAIFATAPALREQVKLEFTFASPALPAEERSLRSFIAEAQKAKPEVPAIACVTPAETAADKLSALTWRVLTRKRGGERDDPTLIRHLHDLAALEDHAMRHARFPQLLHSAITGDVGRAAVPPEFESLGQADRVTAAINILAKDPGYHEEYKQFVLAMSYANSGDIPGFEAALEAVKRLHEHLI